MTTGFEAVAGGGVSIVGGIADLEDFSFFLMAFGALCSTALDVLMAFSSRFVETRGVWDEWR